MDIEQTFNSPVEVNRPVLFKLKRIIKRLAPLKVNAPYGSRKMIAIILRGSVVVALSLTLLLIIYSLALNGSFNSRIYLGLGASLYMIVGEILLIKKYYTLVGWMIILLYSSVSTFILLMWGINASVGILSLGFIIFLSGIILGSRYIITTTLGAIGLLTTIQILHAHHIVTPNLSVLSNTPHVFDIIMYATLFSIFALISWLSGTQVQKTLQRARDAEERLRNEKRNLAHRLEEQSIALRQTQLKEMLQLYKFAEIGQSTTATLHELANHLSVLNLDIDDIEQQHQHSEALSNAKQSINHVNELVRQARWRLHDNRKTERFNAVHVLNQTLKELGDRFEKRGVILKKLSIKNKTFFLRGDSLSFSHVLTILLNNGLDACTAKNSGYVSIAAFVSNDKLTILIKDNGPGIPFEAQDKIFQPHQSSKPSGLGIGLYITKHILVTQFRGEISFDSNESGTTFTVIVPKKS